MSQKKMLSLAVTLIGVLSLVAAGCSGKDFSTFLEDLSSPSGETQNTNAPTTPSSATSTPSAATSLPAGAEKVPLLKVVDGDTIQVTYAGVKESVRLIGFNTPETVDPRRPVECFGKEASAHAKEVMKGSEIFLLKDASQGDRDKYGRLLRYAYLADGTNVNLRQIADGFAYEYTYEKSHPYLQQASFRAAEATAKKEKRGLWATDTCNGVK